MGCCLATLLPSEALESSVTLEVSSTVFADDSPECPIWMVPSDIPETAVVDADAPLDVFFRLLLFFVRLEAPVEW